MLLMCRSEIAICVVNLGISGVRCFSSKHVR